jgi:lipopolysaccharide exporter
MSGAFLLAAPLAELIFDSTRVVAIAQVLAASFFLQGLGVTATSLLRRQLRFKTLAVIEVLSSVCGYMAVGLSFALAGAGVWSLVAAGLAQAGLASIIALALVRHPMRLTIDWADLRSLYSFGGRISVISLFEFFGSSLDTLFIGRFAGEAPLGQYNRARLLVKLPLDRITQGTAKVLFPAFSRVQHDHERLRAAYLTGLRGMSLLIIPAAAGMAVAARELQLVVLGPQWEEAARVLPYLALLVATTLTAKMAAIICEAVAALNAKLLLTVGHVALLSLLLWLSIGGDLEGYARAIATAGGVRLLAYTALMRRVLGVGWRAHLQVLGPILVTAAAVAASIAGVSALVRPLVPVGVVLAAQMATGAILLLLALFGGPLGGVRRDLHRRLHAAGMLPGRGRMARGADLFLRRGR